MDETTDAKLEETEDHGDLLTVDGHSYYRPAGDATWWDQGWRLTDGGSAQVTGTRGTWLTTLADTLERESFVANYPMWDVEQLQKQLAKDLAETRELAEVEGFPFGIDDEYELAESIGISQYDEAGHAALTAALDAPLDGGPSLRELYPHTGEVNC